MDALDVREGLEIHPFGGDVHSDCAHSALSLGWLQLRHNAAVARFLAGSMSTEELLKELRDVLQSCRAGTALAQQCLDDPAKLPPAGLELPAGASGEGTGSATLKTAEVGLSPTRWQKPLL